MVATAGGASLHPVNATLSRKVHVRASIRLSGAQCAAATPPPGRRRGKLRAVLVLFDIDGTLLLRAADAHRDALLAALREVHGVDASARVQTAGRTDPAIARDMLLGAGVGADRIEARADDVRVAASAAYARLCPADLSAHAPAGMVGLLEDAALRHRLSLVTGNYEAIARLKLRRAGLGRFFAFGQGGFGSDREDRSELPAVARARAGAPKHPWPREHTVVVGDTPLDIACARADGLQCLAVATGPFPAEELQDADGVARDARELAVLLNQLPV